MHIDDITDDVLVAALIERGVLPQEGNLNEAWDPQVEITLHQQLRFHGIVEFVDGVIFRRCNCHEWDGIAMIVYVGHQSTMTRMMTSGGGHTVHSKREPLRVDPCG